MPSVPENEQGKEIKMRRLVRERDRAKEALLRTEKHFLLLLENSLDIITIITDDGTVLNVTDSVNRILGYNTDEWFGCPVYDFVNPENVTLLRESVNRAIREPEVAQSAEFGFLHKNGERRFFASISIGMLSQANRDEVVYIVINSRDITEMVRARERLRKLSAAIEQAAEMVLISDSEGKIEYVNPAFEKGTGYPREQVIGGNPRILKSGSHNDIFYKEMWETIKRGKVWRGELVNRKQSGDLYEEEMTISPVYDENRAISHFVSIKRDISGEKMMKEQLAHTEKLSSIGTFVAGVAHEINNPLTIIAGHAHILSRRRELSEEVREKLELITKHSNRCIKIVQQLLKFTRKQTSDRGKINLNELLVNTLELQAHLLKTDNIEVITKYQEGIPLIMGVESQLQQVFINVILNARHEMLKEKGKGTIGITTGSVNGTVSVMLENDGPPIPDHVIQKVFDPFFTTKKVGEGTGLGLSMSFGIIRDHGGTIRVENITPGSQDTGGERGVRFVIELPVNPP